MNIAEIITADSANGQGMRVSVFVSGCTLHCKGCFQPQTWDFNYGHLYDDAMEDRIIDELKKPYYDGLTILGGEPFEPANQEGIVRLIRRMKKELPQRNLWMFTGFLYERDLVKGGCRYTVYTDEILDAVDVLVEGPFIEEQRNLMLRFRGSENQKILDMKATRAGGVPVLHPLNNQHNL